jgi:anti-anti-sigma regulatory factor
MQIAFQGRCTVEQMQELSGQLAEAIERSEQVVLDLTAVQACDVSLLQLLCSAGKTASRKGKKLVLHQPVPESIRSLSIESGFKQACQLCSCTSCLIMEDSYESNDHDRG